MNTKFTRFNFPGTISRKMLAEDEAHLYILHVELKSAKDFDHKDGFDLLNNSSDRVKHELIFSPSPLLI